MQYQENALLYDDYFRLRSSVGWSNFSQKQTKAALRQSLYDVVALDGAQVVGMGRLVGDGLYDTIVDVVVQPEYQRMGVGSGILRMLLAYAEQNTPDGGHTSVQLIAAKGKEPFYEKKGFWTIPDENCGPGMRQLIHKEPMG